MHCPGETQAPFWIVAPLAQQSIILSLVVLLKHLTFEALVRDEKAQFLPVGQVAFVQEFKGLEP